MGLAGFHVGMGVLACSLALLLAGSGGSAHHLETALQDDALLLHRPAPIVRQTALTIAAVGVDRVRLTADWSTIAPAPRSRHRPAFDATDPSAYPRGAWERLDTAVHAAHDAGLAVMLDVGFWAPRWAVRKPSANPARQRYAPNPAMFADFATAVARRYGAIVDIFTPWNEPNHPSFLAPQWRRGRPLSPHVYRAMYEAAYAAIKQARPQAKVLLGNTAATGGGGVPPLRFLRELACVDRRMQPLRVPECAGFRPLQADGYAHHPYSRATDPAASDPDPDDAPLGDSGRLEALLAQLAQAGRITSKLPLYITEYGYESRPDDPNAPFDRNDQARWLAKASFLAWQDPNTQLFAQFLLRDLQPARDWQSGLYAADGTPKPALQAFKLPFWVELRDDGHGGRFVLAWGIVRPGHGRQLVRVEEQSPDGAWHPVRVTNETCDGGMDALTDPAGTFLGTLPAVPGSPTYRMAWRRPDGIWETSVPVTLTVSAPSA